MAGRSRHLQGRSSSSSARPKTLYLAQIRPFSPFMRRLGAALSDSLGDGRALVRPKPSCATCLSVRARGYKHAPAGVAGLRTSTACQQAWERGARALKGSAGAAAAVAGGLDSFQRDNASRLPARRATASCRASCGSGVLCGAAGMAVVYMRALPMLAVSLVLMETLVGRIGVGAAP